MNNSIRILCLHEEGSNALTLKAELRKLGERLYVEHKIDLVYVNAPIARGNTSEDDDDNAVFANGETSYGQRLWWDADAVVPQPPLTFHSLHEGDFEDDDDDDKCFSSDLAIQNLDSRERSSLSNICGDSNADNNGKDFVGLDASVLLPRQVWRSSSTIGILGIGQGASMSALLTLILQEEAGSTGKLLPPQFAVFINARSSLLPSDFVLGDSIPRSHSHWRHPQFLHLYSDGCVATNDGQTNKNDSAEASLLHKQLGGEWCQHGFLASSQRHSCRTELKSNPDGGIGLTAQQPQPKWIPTTNDLNRIGRFLVAQKNRLGHMETHDQGQEYSDQTLESQESAALLAIQQALHEAEEEAASLIAAEISAHPPKALMAVIQPSRVAGRQRESLDRPPGGGAPCPSEFLLHREKRTSREGPARAHPLCSKENDMGPR